MANPTSFLKLVSYQVCGLTTLVAVSLLSSLSLSFSANADDRESDPIIIAHRGASGLMPEHTLPAYKLGIEQGAHYIEPDLVMTKDGHLVARHDVYLSPTTDVATHPEFADRKKRIAGHDDWFVFDFTLAELKTLKARQPRAGRSQENDGLFDIVTLSEIVHLVKQSAPVGKVGLYIEMKRPSLFEERVNLDLANILSGQLNAIADAGIDVYFQCFEIDFLKKIAPLTNVDLVYLDGGTLNESSGHYTLTTNLSEYYDFIDGFGLYKQLLVDTQGQPTDVVTKLHEADKILHVWTARDDALPPGFKSGSEEITTLLKLGVDGVFTDFPATGITALEKYKNEQRD